MRRRIREIHRTKPISFAERIEAQARRVIHREQARSRSAHVASSTLTHRIALTLDQLDQARRTHTEIRRSLEQHESNLRVEIRQREPRAPVYEDPRLPERDMLRGRLLRLGQEHRRLLATEQRELRDIEERLAQLVGLARRV